VPDTDVPAGPSEIVRYFVDRLVQILPEDQVGKLTAHDEAVMRTTSRGDFHRCVHCATWAVEVTADPDRSHLEHLSQKAKMVLHELHDTGWAFNFGFDTAGRIVTDVELSWVDDALSTAQGVAEHSGWDAVPWERLLEELIAIEPSAQA
jgi:hypothetical protein